MEEEDLIIHYKKNNNLMIDNIINKYTNYVYTIIKNVSFNFSNEDVEEIILDVFLAILNNKNNLKDNMPLKPYIAGITKNIIKNKYRNIILEDDIAQYDNIIKSNIDIQLLIEQKEKNALIEKALNTMKEEDKNIFIYFYYNNMDIKRISSILHLSKSNVKTKLHRIRKILRKSLNEGGYKYEYYKKI